MCTHKQAAPNCTAPRCTWVGGHCQPSKKPPPPSASFLAEHIDAARTAIAEGLAKLPMREETLQFRIPVGCAADSSLAGRVLHSL